jgi:regulator of sirC expression with transglutaminase-like and TPR domain
VPSPLEYLSRLAELDDGGIDLARSALELARLAHPELEVESYLRTLDQLARPIPRAPAPLAQIDRINHWLFELEGFRGNRSDYYDPRNCYLNEVIDRRLGIPITLSVIYLEVARRIGLDLVGVGMPGHFIVKLPDPSGDLLIDPFEQGRLLTLDDCQARLQQIYGKAARLESYMLQPVSKKQILARLLNNLKHIWIDRRDFKRALAVTQLHLALYPRDAEALKQRAWLYAHLNDFRSALADLERCGAIGRRDEDWVEVVRALYEVRITASTTLN